MNLSVRLPTTAVSALADLVAAGFGAVQALEALPRRSLSSKIRHQLDREVGELKAGGTLEVAFERLGLDITAASFHASRGRGSDLETAIRADATAQLVATDALRKVRVRIAFFGLLMAGLALSTLVTSLIVVPNMISDSLENMPADWPLPPALLHFERFRDLWLSLGGGFFLSCIALAALYAGILGREKWTAFYQELRLYLPFLRGHAIHGCSARLLEALAYEQMAGIPANQTIRRLHLREPVPRLRAALLLGAERLDAGVSWEGCLRGTLLDTPKVADLTALAGHGARPTKGFQWAATHHREQSIKGLKRAVSAAAALVLIPSFLYLVVLLHIASTTAAIAQLDSIHQQMEELTDEVESIMDGDRESRP